MAIGPSGKLKLGKMGLDKVKKNKLGKFGGMNKNNMSNKFKLNLKKFGGM